MTDLVRGEASESDEEVIKEGLAEKTGIFATEISGEATESDEDLYEKNAQVSQSSTNVSHYANNLLQRKLIETNFSLWKSCTSFVRQFVTSASKQLLNTDQLLIKAQVSIQSVISSLKVARGNVKQLHEKTEDIFTTSFIPTIYVQNKD